MVRAGWIMTALVVLFLLGASAAPKLFGADVAIDSLQTLGWQPRYLVMIGAMELLFTILYALPRTGLIGAVLLTGLLGGALASNLRADMPLFSHTLFSIYLGLFVWAALWLRDPGLRRYLRF
jgi:DoxX-like family